jgi:hypothetical protein
MRNIPWPSVASAALLVDEVFPEQPVRQWVLSFPYPLCFLFASRPAIMGQVLGFIYRVIATQLIKKSGFSRKTARAVDPRGQGAVTHDDNFSHLARRLLTKPGQVFKPCHPHRSCHAVTASTDSRS